MGLSCANSNTYSVSQMLRQTRIFPIPGAAKTTFSSVVESQMANGQPDEVPPGEPDEVPPMEPRPPGELPMPNQPDELPDSQPSEVPPGQPGELPQPGDTTRQLNRSS